MTDDKLEEPGTVTPMSRTVSGSKLWIHPCRDSKAAAHIEQDACVQTCCLCQLQSRRLASNCAFCLRKMGKIMLILKSERPGFNFR